MAAICGRKLIGSIPVIETLNLSLENSPPIVMVQFDGWGHGGI